MTGVESELRAAVVAAALTWLHTPYRSCARVKGAGVDCANLVAAAFEEAGVVMPIDLGQYPPEWHLHRSEERFLTRIAEYCRPLALDEAPQPGDIALFRFGRCVSHGAILLDRDRVIHAFLGRGVIYDDLGPGSALVTRLAGYWTPQAWERRA